MTDKPLKVAPNGVVDKLALLDIRDRAVYFSRSHTADLFYNMGGKREKKPDGRMEDDIEALLREAIEETGKLVIYNTLRLAFMLEGPCHGYVEGTILRMTCYFGELDGEPLPSGEIAEHRRFTTANAHETTKMGQEILFKLKELDLID